MHIKTLQDIVINSKNNYGNCLAFQIKDGSSYRRITYDGVYESVLKLATYLKKHGISHGQKVSIFSENSPEWAMAYLAIGFIGAVCVPLDPLLSDEELNFILNDSGTRLILVSKGLALKHKLSTETFLLDNIKDLIDGDEDFVKVDENDLLAIVYTSGTTGKPKGVMLTHKNIISNVLDVAKLFKIKPGDNFLSVLPLHHTFESTCGLLAPFYLGAAVTYAESLKSYNLLKNMQETKVTVMCGVPLLYNLFYDGILREIEEKGLFVKKLFSFLIFVSKAIKWQWFRSVLFFMVHKKLGGRIRFWVSGGAAIDPKLIYGFRLLGITIFEGYGLTESSPILTCNNFEHDRIGSVGLPLPSVSLRLTAEDEITAKGPNIMLGYHNRPDLTAHALKDGWLYTGDRGKIDKDGYVYITGRIKDIIITGAGVNVSPDELEFHINRIRGVKESCVTGIKIQSGIHRGAEEVVAIIVPDYDFFTKHRSNVKPAEIEMYLHGEVQKLNEKLAAYKRIAKIKVRSIELPKTSTRKIKRFEVKKEMGL